MSREIAGAVLVALLNTVVRKHKRKFQRDRALPAAKTKPAVTGGNGVAFGATKIGA